MPPLEQALIGTAALSAIVSAALMIYLIALRFVAADLVPASAVAHMNWWRRRARPCLWIGLAITATTLTATLVLRIG